MNELRKRFERFCLRNRNKGIPNLMLVIAIGNVIVYFLSMIDPSNVVYSWLCFSSTGVLHGQVWRLFTYIFTYLCDSAGVNLFLSVVALFCYYQFGRILEQYWGALRFNLYYFTGILLTDIAALLLGYPATAGAMNLSLFLAVATLAPESQVLLFFIIPIKMKWLAILDAVLFAVDILGALLRLDFVSALIPVIALLNFLVFFWTDLSEAFGSRRRMARHQNSHQTIQFKSAVKQQQKKESQQGYRHKCCVCGRTDTDYPDLEFRYCSRCAGYHCFCQDHIFNHVHFTE